MNWKAEGTRFTILEELFLKFKVAKPSQPKTSLNHSRAKYYFWVCWVWSAENVQCQVGFCKASMLQHIFNSPQIEKRNGLSKHCIVHETVLACRLIFALLACRHMPYTAVALYNQTPALLSAFGYAVCLCTSVEQRNEQSPLDDCLPDCLMLPWLLSLENPTITTLPSHLLQELHCCTHNCNAIHQPAFLSEMIASMPSAGFCHVSITCETPFSSGNNTSTWNGWVHD